MATDVGEFAYSQRVYGQMDEWQKAEWHRNMGQYEQAKMYQIAAGAKDTANIALQSVQAAAAFAVESEPGLVPPPWRGEIFWSEGARSAREMELFAPLAGMAREQAMKRTAEAAAANVRTSASVQENIARSEQRALQQAQQQSWSQARQEEYAQAEFKQREKFAREMQRFEAAKQNRERLRQAKLKLIAAIGPIAQQGLTSLTKGGIALGEGVQATKAEAAALGTDPKGMRQGKRAAGFARREQALGRRAGEMEPEQLQAREGPLVERMKRIQAGKEKWAERARGRGLQEEYLGRFLPAEPEPEEPAPAPAVSLQFQPEYGFASPEAQTRAQYLDPAAYDAATSLPSITVPGPTPYLLPKSQYSFDLMDQKLAASYFPPKS